MAFISSAFCARKPNSAAAFSQTAWQIEHLCRQMADWHNTYLTRNYLFLLTVICKVFIHGDSRRDGDGEAKSHGGVIRVFENGEWMLPPQRRWSGLRRYTHLTPTYRLLIQSCYREISPQTHTFTEECGFSQCDSQKYGTGERGTLQEVLTAAKGHTALEGFSVFLLDCSMQTGVGVIEGYKRLAACCNYLYFLCLL